MTAIERDAQGEASWRELSFRALHEVVNPLFAIETFLDPLERRIRESRPDEACQVVASIRASIAKAKAVIESFQSRARAAEELQARAAERHDAEGQE